MRAWSLVAVLPALCLCACNGPKSTCQGSVDSYYALLKGHDWEGVYEMLTPEYQKKARSAETLGAFMEDYWKGSKSFSIELQNVAESGNGVCVANGTMNYTIRLRGKNPEDISNEYFAWTFHLLKDGKWYIDLPGEEKLSGY